MQAAQEFERAKQYLTVFSKFKELLICFELKSNKMSISTLPSLMNISLSYDQNSEVRWLAGNDFRQNIANDIIRYLYHLYVFYVCNTNTEPLQVQSSSGKKCHFVSIFNLYSK